MNKKYRVGVDLGGTNIAVGVIDENYNIIGRGKLKTNVPRPAEEIMADIVKAVKMAVLDAGISLDEVESIGIGTPGNVNKEKGVIEYANNLYFNQVPAVELINKLVDAKVYLENDANCAALGEAIAGVGKGRKLFIAVTLGTGVGGGVILGGKILTGTKGAAGEIGHMTVEYDEEETCNCGTKGCLEQYASATGIVRLAKKQMVETSALAKIDNLTAKDVFDEAKAGDAYALQIVDRFARYLGVALGNVAQIIDPEAFVIGGGVARAGSIITESIEKYYNDSVMFALRGKQFNLAELGNDAGIYGAVRMVL